MPRRSRVDASVNPYPPNAGDGGARTATSFVANFKRSEDAKDERQGSFHSVEVQGPWGINQRFEWLKPKLLSKGPGD
jgi:hypothetical protein